jgi:glycosyltransferase involved in cell wall biosynthesis
MGERLWVSHYSLDDITGGTEVLGGQFSRAMGLKYMSARKVGATREHFWDTSRAMDDWIRGIPDIDVLVRNSTIGTTFGEAGPNANIDIVVCCENFRAEGEAVEHLSQELYAHKMKDHERQMRAVDSADTVVVISNGEAMEFIKDGVSPNRIRIIEPHVDLEIFKPGDEKVPRTAIFVGRKHIRKGWDIVEELTARFPDISFRTLTDGYFTQEYVAGEYERADFLIMPSRYESFGFIYAEALACNLPIVSSRVGLFKTWQPSQYGVFPEEITTDAFVEAIERFYSIDEFADSRALAVEFYSKERFKEDCNALLSDRQ